MFLATQLRQLLDGPDGDAVAARLIPLLPEGQQTREGLMAAVRAPH